MTCAEGGLSDPAVQGLDRRFDTVDRVPYEVVDQLLLPPDQDRVGVVAPGDWYRPGP